MRVNPAQTYGRVRRLASRYCFGIETQIRRIQESAEIMHERDVLVEYNEDHCDLLNKNDWEALLVFLARLRKCLLLLGRCRPQLPLKKQYLRDFDRLVPHLVNLRDFEEHFDEYSSGRGKREEYEWGHLETYVYGDEMFSSGVGHVSIVAAKEAAKLAWQAVLSVEQDARNTGYLTWEDRYGQKKGMGEAK